MIGSRGDEDVPEGVEAKVKDRVFQLVKLGLRLGLPLVDLDVTRLADPDRNLVAFEREGNPSWRATVTNGLAAIPAKKRPSNIV